MRSLLIALSLLVAADAGWCATCADRPAKEVSAECQSEARRSEIRTLASSRLAAVSNAIAEVASRPGKTGGVLAVAKDGRPAAWCEALFNDVLAQRNLAVVDDDHARAPRWIAVLDKNGQRSLQAGPILDPAFKQWRLRDEPVVQGYVTLRWRGEFTVVLRMEAACDEADAATRCDQQRHLAAHVYDVDVPFACTASVIERRHWANWKDALVPIRLAPPPATSPATPVAQSR